MSRPATLPAAIVFDWDNTLVDSWPTIHAALEATFAAMGHAPWTLEETKTRVRKSLRDSFPALFGADWERAGEIFYAHYDRLHLANLTPVAGSAEMLGGIGQLGIPLFVVSNKKGTLLRAEARHLGWEARFSRLVGALDAPEDKPAPAPLHLALAGAGLAPGPGIWYVGDTEMDMAFATATGCVPILMRATPPGDAEFDLHPPACYFNHCREFMAYLRALAAPTGGGSGKTVSHRTP